MCWILHHGRIRPSPLFPGSHFNATCPSTPVLERFIMSFFHVSQKPTITICHSLMEHVSFERLSGSLQSMVYGIILLMGKIQPALEGYRVYVCTYIHICVYMCVHIYICVYMYTHTHIYNSREQLQSTLKFKRWREYSIYIWVYGSKSC